MLNLLTKCPWLVWLGLLILLCALDRINAPIQSMLDYRVMHLTKQGLYHPGPRQQSNSLLHKTPFCMIWYLLYFLFMSKTLIEILTICQRCWNRTSNLVSGWFQVQGRFYFDFFLFSPGKEKGKCASELDIVDTLITSG